MIITSQKLHVDNNSYLKNESNSYHEAKSQYRVGKYILTKTIGKGSMGKVKLAIDTETKEKMAVKIVSRKIIKTNISKAEEKKQLATEIRREIRTVREASIMLLLDHPFIIRVQEMILVDDFYYIFMEYVDGGQLLDYIISHGKLKEKQARLFSRQIASALDYCHRNSIVHRDLKVENILISKSGNIKIIDFGLSNLFSPRSHLSTFCGSLYFAAPELLNGKIYTGPEVDVWSFGIVIYVLVCGQVPFDDPTIYGLHKKVKQGIIDYPSYLSTDLKNLLQFMLMIDPKKRYSMSEIILHPWMTKQFDISSIDNYLPIRKPLQLPLNIEIVNGMKGFGFGTQDIIIKELEFLISNTESKVSSSVAYHPLVSIYYLVKERMERNQLNHTSQPSQDSICVHKDIHLTGEIASLENIYQVPSTIDVFRRISRRWSGNHDEYSPENNSSNKQQQHSISLGQKLNIFLKRRSTITTTTIQDSPPCTPTKRNSVACKIQKENDFLHNGQADEIIRSVYLKGLFSVSTTSTKKASVIRCEIICTLDKYKDIIYRETRDRFQCSMGYSNEGPSIQFEVYIVKIPWLLGMRGIQFRRTSGDPWKYKNTCSKILCDLRL